MYLHLVEFPYSNGKQTSLEISPFEALYGRKCITPVTGGNLVNIFVLGTKLLKDMEQEVANIRKNLKASQYRHKSVDFLSFKSDNYFPYEFYATNSS